jgi:DNA-binding transcriptional LysR family regulator
MKEAAPVRAARRLAITQPTAAHYGRTLKSAPAFVLFTRSQTGLQATDVLVIEGAMRSKQWKIRT